MKYCFPIANAQGLASEVFEHFGSAPMFLIVDDQDRSTELVRAPARKVHGGCRPVQLLEPHGFDAMVVCGIGHGAISKIAGMGKKIFLATAPTVAENLALLDAQALEQCDPAGHCERSGHAHGHRHGVGVGGCGGHGHGFGAGRGQRGGGVMGHGGCGHRGRGRG